MNDHNTNCLCQAEARQENTGCGCRNNTWRNVSRSGCGCCQNNTWRNVSRSGCGCQNNTFRNSSRTECTETVTKTTFCNTPDTVWKNNTCGCNGTESAAVRTTCTECARGAEGDACLSGRSLSMVYSPYQKFGNLYDSRQGLCNGTVFCELDKPFLGSGR